MREKVIRFGVDARERKLREINSCFASVLKRASRQSFFNI